MKITKVITFLFLAIAAAASLYAQGNYEVQVYGSDTVAPKRTMIELHSNFTFQGLKTADHGVLPTEHQLHETLEITQGWNEWFETGFYNFTSYGPDQGYRWVGSHIRPRAIHARRPLQNTLGGSRLLLKRSLAQSSPG